jgi:hypothetical protein
MKKKFLLLITIILLTIACVKDFPSGQKTPAGDLQEGNKDNYGYLLTPVTEEEAAAFMGSWKGNISGFDFILHISAEGGGVGAVLDIDGGSERLFVLGANETTLYMFRKIDNACLSIYFVEGDLLLEYYEQGAPRVIPLTPLGQ